METFLVASRKCLVNLKDYHLVRVILGNPTCDLDSAVCALAQGFFEYKEAEDKDAKLAIIPVLNVAKNEFRLRTEVLHYLRRCQVSRDLLTFRNEIDLWSLHDSGKLELILVDHHALPPEDAGLGDSVIEIIDHRPHDANWPWTGRKLTLRTVGSCATLVARNILECRPDTMLPALSSLLQGPILIDTVNFSKEADRATLLDHEIMTKLDKISGTSAEDRSKLYQDILDAKTDISELTPGDLLIKDLKVVNGVPIPGFPILVKDFLQLEGATEALEAFRKERGYGLVILIGLNLKNDNVTRDIAIYSSTSGQPTNKLIEALTTSTNPNLQLTEAKREESGSKLLVLYKQDNVRASRKQILPIIQSALSA